METRNILVPIDFSVCSKHALKVAIELAMRWESHIHLINAIHVPATHAEFGTHTVIEPVIQDYEESTKKSFDSLEDEIPALKAITYHTKSYVSSIIEAVQTEMETKKIDLVIMGTKGAHDPLERLLGSVASDVIERSKVPVLMIPENVTSLSIKKIGLAIDNKAITMPKKLDIIAAIADVFDASITIFNIHKSDETVNFEHSHNGRILEKLLKHTKHEYKHLASKDFEEGIYQFIGGEHLDMIVMMPRRHAFFDRIFHKSATRNVSMKVKVPMLSINQ